MTGARPLSGSCARGTSARQRTIFSEALIPADGRSDAGSERLRPKTPSTPRGMAGPSRHKEFRSAQETRHVQVSSFSQKTKLCLALAQPAKGHCADVDPKVCEPFKTMPGRPPRRVRVERLRRQFEAEDISELLRERGVDYSDPLFEEGCTLPLDPFDDTEFDVRTPAEWLALGKDPVTGIFKPLAAQALLFEHGAGFWRRALVSDYDPKLQQFEVRWDEGSLIQRAADMLPRLRVLFAAEDPAIFADRCKAAHDARRFAEIMIKYNFFIDNMPTDDVQNLNSDQTERLVESLYQPRKSVEEEAEISEVESVLQEIQLDFARTMNRIVFDVHLLERPDDDPMHKGLRPVAELSPVAAAVLHNVAGAVHPVAPQYGLVPIPPHNFAETFASLCLSTLRVRPEVVLALHGIRGTCLRMVNEEIVFCTSFRKPLRLEEFRQMQRTTLSAASFQLKEAWCATLHQTILREFASVGKGWFNINETSRDLFKRGKLIRFLSLVRLIMQDTLRDIIKNSIDAYMHIVDTLIPLRSTVHSLSSIACTWRGLNGEETEASPMPLFCVEVFRKDGHDHDTSKATFALSTEPQRFVTAAIEAFDGGLVLANEVQSLERLVVPHLSKMQSPQYLNGVDVKEQWVVQARQHLEARFDSACPALVEFLSLLKNYEDLLRLDPQTHVKKLMEKRGTTADDAKVQAMIETETTAQAELIETVPECVHVGIFQVGCKDLRRHLVQKHDSVIALFYDELLQRLRTQFNETFDSFQSIAANLKKTPRTIEELVDMRRYTEGVPRQVTQLREKISKDIRLFDRLEDLRFYVPLEDVRNRWTLTAAPKAALELMISTQRALQKSEENFTKQMLAQQEDFQGTLDDIDQIIELFRSNPVYRDIEKTLFIKDIVDNCNDRIASAGQQAKLFNMRETLLCMPTTDYSQLQESAHSFEPYSALWLVVASWLTHKDSWRNGPLLNIDATHLEHEVYNGAKQLFRICRIFRDDPGQGEVLAIATQVHKELEEFRPCVPLIVALRTEGMHKCHWDEISAVVGHDLDPDMADFTLVTVLGEPYLLQNHCQTVQDIADRAAKEFSIETRLRSMQSDWENVNFDCSHPHRNTGTYILKGVDVVSTLLDEQLVGVQTLQFSLFKGNLSDEIDAWASKLRHMSDHLEEWTRCQKSWRYLHPIFDSADVMRQLPAESRRFKGVDSLWRSIMKHTHETPHALTCLCREGFTDRWLQANMTLDAVKHCLEEYLESKRAKFSRFYFLSNDELLEIISQTKDPTRVQPFLKKVYESMGRLSFQEDSSIVAMASLEGEEISFVQPISVRDSNVELWMREVELAMFAAVRWVVGAAVEDYSDQPRSAWVQSHPAQAVLSGSQAHWTAEVEVALGGSDTKEDLKPIKEDPKMLCRYYLKKLEKQLLDSVMLIRSAPSKLIMDTVCSLIVLDVHQKDIVNHLIAAGCPGISSFEWLSQLRVMWCEDEQLKKAGRGSWEFQQPCGDLWVHSLHTIFPYGYEYLGSTKRLVITPLTDKCFMTLLSAQILNLGGCPLGPAGTGKTETTKDLAKAVAKRCVVFNCSDGMDHLMVGRFFKGLASSGFWCCFDEFNRIDIEVLSVIAQQLLVLFGAKAELVDWSETKSVEFEGSTIAVSRTFNVYVTMNPNYVGRTELPDNLKALFRPVAMMVPQYTHIAEIMLYSFGFASARELARKVTTAFKLSSEQLSLQGHYDYGMRAVRTVIDAAGMHKRVAEVARAKSQMAQEAARELRTSIAESSANAAIDEEPQLLLRALQDVNMAKFVDDDIPLFQDIIRDLFPEIELSAVEDSMIEAGITRACKKLSLQCVPSFRDKVLQLHGTMQVRHGLMLVGLPGGGKTCCYRVLHEAICALARDQVQEYSAVKLHILNPKAVTMGQLYGEFDKNSHDWSDGILAETMRMSSRDTSGHHHWIMFDGPVDSVWVESLNTVLDDNKKLCLNSSEIIQLTSQVVTMFEVDDLEHASPATISRCGMVHVDPAALGTTALVSSWLGSLPPALVEHRARIEYLCGQMLTPMIAFVRSPDCTELLPTTDDGLCTSFLLLMTSQLEPFAARGQREKSGDLNKGRRSSQQSAQRRSLPQSDARPVSARRQSQQQSDPQPSGARRGSTRPARSSFLQPTTPTAPAQRPSVTPTGSSSPRTSLLEFVPQTDVQRHLDQLTLFSLAWSVGASCDADSRQRFNTKLRQIAFKCSIDVRGFESMDGIHGRLYKQETGLWIPWMETEPDFHITQTHGEQARFEDIVVPTVDSVRTAALMRCLIMGQSHVLCTGPTGTGKSTIIKRLLFRESLPRHVSVSMDLSARTRARDLQDVLDGKLEKRRRGVYGPPAGDQCVFFIDDLNLPRREQYGAQPPLELLRLWFDHGGWYRWQELAFSQVVDISMVGAMGPAGGGRQVVSKRLTRHYHCLALPELTETSTADIFGHLSAHFCASFPTKPREMVPELVPATVAIFESIRQRLLPTPQKTHYTFNLRDVWKVFQGICSLSADAVSSRAQLARAWCHENIRVFRDRFISASDQELLHVLLVQHCTQHFYVVENDVFIRDRLIFSCVAAAESDEYVGLPISGLRPYQEVEDLDAFVSTVDSSAQYYNQTMPIPMLLVMFLDACDHVARICRVLRQPGGNCLLIGIGGSGRQSLSRLASFCMKYHLCQIDVVKGYRIADWRSDLKASLMKAGLEWQSQSFLLCDRQVFSEEMIENVNSVLNSGDVSKLYTAEDFELILQDCTHLCHQARLEPTKANIFNTYVQQVRRHMHLLLAFSPSSENFRARLRMFPALVNCCTMDWFFEWPADALLSVAERQLPTSDLETDAHDSVISVLPELHVAACKATSKYNAEFKRHCYVTPACYLEIIGLFQTILDEQRAENLRQQRHFQSGVDKLVDAVQQVEVMKSRLLQMTPILEKTKAEVSVVMGNLESDKHDADMTREWVAREEAEAKAKDAECRAKAEDAERDLSLALPALHEAVECVTRLTESQIREVKAMRSPPAGVELVMTAVCIMLGVKPVRKPGLRVGERVDDYWEVVHTTLLKQPQKFLDDLLNYDKDNISEDIIRKIRPYLERDDFEPTVIRKTSVACEAMSLWVRAMVKYHEISKSVEPKRLKLQAAQLLFDKSKENLQLAQERLAGADEKVDRLEAESLKLVSKQDSLAQEIWECESKIEHAQRLTSGLSGEQTRWKELVARLSKQYCLLIGDVVYAAGMVAYSGVFDGPNRNAFGKDVVAGLERKGIPHTLGYLSLQKVLGEAAKLQEWRLNGLPDDSFSVENAIVMHAARRWPLMIDPQKQANLFLKSLAKKSKDIDVTKRTDTTFFRILEVALTLGKTLLVEQVGEEPDPMLEPILEQRRVKEHGDWVVHIGDKTIPWIWRFRLMMTTMLPNPHFSPEICAKLTVINFVITAAGLEEQLLALVVAKESPELQEKKDELVASGMRMRGELEESERYILDMLSKAEGSILLDEQLVDALAASKRTAAAVNEKMEESDNTEAEIDEARRVYAGVAVHSVLLFTALMELAKLDNMYQFSLQWFRDQFLLSIEEAPMTTDLRQRLENLKSNATSRLYRSVARALFEDHKLLFALSLCIKGQLAAGRLGQAEVEFLVTGIITAGDALPPIPNPTDFLTEGEWKMVLALGKLTVFTGIEVSFDMMRYDWQKFHDAPQAEHEQLPGTWQHRLTNFQRLCLLRAIRIDCLERAVEGFIDVEMGRQYVDPPAFSLSACFADATNASPLIFILVGGSDPVADVQALAVEMKMSKHFESISLGQGQGGKAKKMFQDAVVEGLWLLLCNCHLGISWLPELERLWEELQPDMVHRDFRLWLSSCPCAEFPTQILQAGLKMTNAPPRGVRANLLQTFVGMDEQSVDGGTPHPQIYRRLMFALCFFHAIVVERQRFGPIGWNVAYKFTPEDLSACRKQLQLLLRDADSHPILNVPYKAIKYLTTTINYGGRVTDDLDQRLMDTIIERYICKDLAEGKEAYMLASGSHRYYRPECETRQDFVDHVMALPMVATPHVFGLHDNARITCQQQESRALLASLALLDSSSRFSNSSSDVARDKRLLQQVRHIRDSSPVKFDTAEAKRKHPPTYDESMNTVLQQEVIRFNGLFGIMGETLEKLERATQGLVVMSEELEKVGTSIYDGQVPAVWATAGFLSLKPLASWIKELGERSAFFQTWIASGIPIVFWISGFFFPQGFLSSVLQNYARRNATAIDRISFKHQVFEQYDPHAKISEPEEGCLAHGFFLEGCRFDELNRVLAHSSPRELFCKLPVVWFLPGSEPERVHSGDLLYQAPTYKVESRCGSLSTTGHSSNHVTTVNLPTAETSSVWILAGVALILSLSV